MSLGYLSDQPGLDEISATAGPAVVQFGTNWCVHCQRAEPVLREVFARNPEIPVLRVEDGKGRPLGRAFGVKLWPTIVFLRDGVEVDRLVRPTTREPVEAALQRALR